MPPSILKERCCGDYYGQSNLSGQYLAKYDLKRKLLSKNFLQSKVRESFKYKRFKLSQIKKHYKKGPKEQATTHRFHYNDKGLPSLMIKGNHRYSVRYNHMGKVTELTHSLRTIQNKSVNISELNNIKMDYHKNGFLSKIVSKTLGTANLNAVSKIGQEEQVIVTEINLFLNKLLSAYKVL